MEDMFEQIAQLSRDGEPFVVATIVETIGSTPRDVGAKMLIRPDGAIVGTIGGGRFEKKVIDDSLQLFKNNEKGLLKQYRFAMDGPDATEMCCGGEAKVYMEINRKPDRLIIIGGGHVGERLVHLARPLGFVISVVDDRQEILDRLPHEVERCLTDSRYRNAWPDFDADSYVVIMTRDHKIDRDVLASVINEDCRFVGMIGSRAKVAKMFAWLEKEGIDRQRLTKVNAPIGLDIGAEGPYEIAVAVIAQLIAVRRKVAGPDK